MVEVLSARPPTPPKASSRTLGHDGSDRFEQFPAVFQTPGESPAPENGSTDGPSTRTSKKVNFSLSPKYIRPPTFTGGSEPSPDLKALTPSNACKPVKSILKATQSPVPASRPNLRPTTPESFAMFLQSITQQLAGESISSRLDAYMQFFGALAAYTGVPGEREMSGKLGLISQFIQRDLTRNPVNNGPLDTNLATQALKLSAALVWSPEISAQLPEDFKVFLVDHSIAALQDAKVPKSVLIHWMSIFSTQNFSAKIITNARVTRLLTALHDLTERVNGNSIVWQRLSIYQRILTQTKPTFVSQSVIWMEHLVFGLLHPKKDIRVKAISLGFHASMILGPNPTLSRNIRDILDRPLDNDRKLVTEVCGRLLAMLTHHDNGIHVPQAWSIVILLLRNRSSGIDQWEHFRDWVLILEKCFNRSEPTIKAQAMLGWNRFVFAVSPNESTSPNMLKMLQKPVLSQFKRKKQDNNAPLPTQLGFSSYYNLLYYAFRPGSSHRHLDTVWEEYVFAPVSNYFASVPTICDRFSEALSSLLWSPQGKVWAENKAIETSKLDPEELPSIDCKWIRSRIPSVLKVFESVFGSSPWADDAVDESNVAAAWISLCNALSVASSKEITPSAESMQAVAHILGLLQRVWTAGPSSLNAAEDQRMDSFFDRFTFLLTIVISSLGSIPFTEKLLLKTTNETFQVANTPTHHLSRENSNLVSPIVHLLHLISDRHDLPDPSSSYLRLVGGTLGAACSGRASRGSRLDFLRQCVDLYTAEERLRFGTPDFPQVVWKAAARLATDSLRSSPTESARERDESVLRDYENIVRILSVGLKLPNVFQEWDDLLDSFIHITRSEKGVQPIATIIIEPLAGSMMHHCSQPPYWPLATLLRRAASIPYNVSERNQALFPQRLVELVDKTLRVSDDSFNSSETAGVADLLLSLASFLGCGAVTFRSTVLERLQGPLALLLKGETRQLNSESEDDGMITACITLSSAVISILQLLPSHGTACFKKFEAVISTGLESSNMLVARKFIDMWNSTFGMQESLDRPECVSRALEKLGYVEPQPSVLPQSDAPETGSQPSPRPVRSAQDVSKDGEAVALSGSLDASSTGLNSPRAFKTEEASNTPSSKQPTNDKSRRRQRSSSGRGVEKSPPGHGNEQNRRNELFSMIANLRSSSPSSTPRQHELKTPPHLRSLRNADPESRIPPTPTAAAENEEVFLGSSPTPGTRTRMQVSELSSSLATRRNRIDVDPPSSPPEIRSLSPNGRNQPDHDKHSGINQPRSGSKETDKTKRDNISKTSAAPVSTPESNRNTYHANNGDSDGQDSKAVNRSSEKRRSAKGRFMKSPRSQRDPDSTPSEGAKRRNRDQRGKFSSKDTPSPASKSNNSRIQRDGGHSKSGSTKPSDGTDSGSDDMETQIASQLEQDLELAVDKDEATSAEQSEPPITLPVAKRKRGVEGGLAPTKERRRSSRGVSNKEPAIDGEIRTIHTRRSTISRRPPSPSHESLTDESRSRKRKSRSEDTASDSASFRPTDDAGTTDQPQAIDGEEESSGPTQKRRKSTRISEHTDSPASEDSSRRTKTPPRSTRKKGKNKANRPRSSLLRSEAPTEETSQAPSSGNVEIQESAVEDTTQASSEAPERSGEDHPDKDSFAAVVGIHGAGPESDTDHAATVDGNGASAQETEAESDKNDAAILRSLRGILGDVETASLNLDTLKEVDNLLFEIRVRAHDALRRESG